MINKPFNVCSTDERRDRTSLDMLMMLVFFSQLKERSVPFLMRPSLMSISQVCLDSVRFFDSPFRCSKHFLWWGCQRVSKRLLIDLFLFFKLASLFTLDDHIFSLELHPLTTPELLTCFKDTQVRAAASRITQTILCFFFSLKRHPSLIVSPHIEFVFWLFRFLERVTLKLLSNGWRRWRGVSRSSRTRNMVGLVSQGARVTTIQGITRIRASLRFQKRLNFSIVIFCFCFSEWSPINNCPGVPEGEEKADDESGDEEVEDGDEDEEKSAAPHKEVRVDLIGSNSLFPLAQYWCFLETV